MDMKYLLLPWEYKPEEVNEDNSELEPIKPSPPSVEKKNCHHSDLSSMICIASDVDNLYPGTNFAPFIDLDWGYTTPNSSLPLFSYGFDLAYLGRGKTCEACQGLKQIWDTIVVSVCGVVQDVNGEERAGLGVIFNNKSTKNICHRVPNSLIFSPPWRMEIMASIMAVMQALYSITSIMGEQPAKYWPRLKNIVLMTDSLFVALGMSREERAQMSDGGDEKDLEPEREVLRTLNDYIEQLSQITGWKVFFRYSQPQVSRRLAVDALSLPPSELFYEL